MLGKWRFLPKRSQEPQSPHCACSSSEVWVAAAGFGGKEELGRGTYFSIPEPEGVMLPAP